MSKFLQVVILSLSVLVVTPAFSQNMEDKKYYVITDSQGKKVYTDKPPIESPQNARELNIRVSNPSLSSNLPEQSDSSQVPFDVDEKIDEDWEEANPGEKFAPNRELACKASQRNLAVLSDNSRPALKMNADGEHVVLDEDARNAEIQKAQSDVSSYCN